MDPAGTATSLDGPKVYARNEIVRLYRFYLSDEHCEAVGDGCLIPAVSWDVARASGSIR